jgi:phosphoglycerate dehydrogenase-like enzyme
MKTGGYRMVAIAILDDYQNVAFSLADWSRLKSQHQVTAINRPFADQEDARKSLAGFDVVCLMRERTPFPRALIEALPNLKLMVTAGMRNASVDMAAAADRKLMVCGTTSGNHATAELAMGLIVALARNFHVEFANMREGRWQTTVGHDLHGKTIGLVGLGRLGGQVARMAQAFGMKAIAWSPNLTAERAKEHGAERVEKDVLFRTADVVSVHLVLSPRSRGTVTAADLALMKPTAYFVNTSRAPLVDNAALASALAAGRIAGAALDVYEVEPLPAADALRREPRAVLTPHIGYVTEETYRLFYGGMIECIEGWLAGKPVRVIEG